MQKFKLRRSDWFILIPSALAVILLLIFSPNIFRPAQVEKRSQPKIMFKSTESRKYSQNQFNPFESITKIEVNIAPEFIRALDAALPSFSGKLVCQKVRYKWVPVDSIVINGEKLDGRYKAKYRGFCSKHWGGKQRSLKIKVIKGDRLLGRKTLNLNAMSSDPEQFEPWSMHFFKLTGGLTSRVGFVNFYLNNQPNGLRQLVENLDQDLILSQGYNKGAIYRERTHAHLGRNGKDLTTLQRNWRKNSMSDAPWGDWKEFNIAIEKSIKKRSRLFLKYLNLEHYINYLAFTSLIGTNHVNDHNIPFYRPKNDFKFIPIGYDFSEPYMALFGLKFSAFQIPYMNLNLLNELIYSDQKLRFLFHKRTAEILQKHYETGIENYSKIFERINPQFSDDIKNNRILDLTIKNIPSEVSGYDQYVKQFGVGRKRFIKKRFDFFYQMYNSPVVRLQPQWQDSLSRQLYIEGYGACALDLSVLNGKECKSSDYLHFQFHDSKVIDAINCVNGKIQASIHIVERSDVAYQNRKLRNTIGGIFINFMKSPTLKLPKIFFKINSLQLDKEISEVKDWPFNFKGESSNRLKIELLANLKQVEFQFLENQQNSFYFGVPYGGRGIKSFKNGIYTFKDHLEKESYV